MRIVTYDAVVVTGSAVPIIRLCSLTLGIAPVWVVSPI